MSLNCQDGTDGTEMGASAKRSATRGKLDQAAIVDAAFDVLNKAGLDGLSLRLVAEQLGVQAPALYWHVHNKAELLSLMAARFHEVARVPARAVGSWRDQLILSARARRRAMLERRDSA